MKMAMIHNFAVIKIGEIDWNEIEISVHDRFIFPNLEKFLKVDTFWGGFDKNSSKGLDWCGYTYIPPISIDAFFEAIKDIEGLEELRDLCLIAKRENAWIEHKGL